MGILNWVMGIARCFTVMKGVGIGTIGNFKLVLAEPICGSET